VDGVGVLDEDDTTVLPRWGDGRAMVGELNAGKSSARGDSGVRGVWKSGGIEASASWGDVGSEGAGETNVLEGTCLWRGTLADMELIRYKILEEYLEGAQLTGTTAQKS
jgi:hypothetical protein